jgi:hypothetical protein
MSGGLARKPAQDGLRVDRERLGPAGKPDQNLAREVAPNDKGLRLTRRFRSDHDAIAGPDVSDFAPIKRLL